jgi:hypothetical protein
MTRKLARSSAQVIANLPNLDDLDPLPQQIIVNERREDLGPRKLLYNEEERREVTDE